MASDPRAPKTLRCAIYTRKSSEEGLEQQFNSLDAQYEACAAYVMSQAGEGWTLLPERYDDGGFSGGSMDRPGVKRLMADIAAGRLDIVVVYKVDRLTRSLADFAKMVEVLDAAGASFVSVTQAFNTTTSMGRLTLNVLLSFAQFEREVTGERIRDKIAASKRKGMWMGGAEPWGYRADGRTLVIDTAEAVDIRRIFTRYLEHGAVPPLAAELNAEGLRSPVRLRQSGRSTGGRILSRGQVHFILANPIYVGLIKHRDQTYPGQHQAIVDQATWDAVQMQLRTNTRGARSEVGLSARGPRDPKAPSLLAGLLFDHQDRPLVPSHAVKGTRRYRYYVSRHWIQGARQDNDGYRFPAHIIEDIAVGVVNRWLGDKAALIDTLAAGSSASETESLLAECEELQTALSAAKTRPSVLAKLVERVVIDSGRVTVRISPKAIRSAQSAEPIDIDIAATMKRIGGVTRLIVDAPGVLQPRAPDPFIVQWLGKAHRWSEMMKDGNTIIEIAAQAKISPSFLTKALRLACLAPDITLALLSGDHPAELTADRLLKRSAELPLEWQAQRHMLGFVDAR